MENWRCYYISYNLSSQKWSASTPENKRSKEEKKRLVQRRFREELGLHIDQPRQGTGNSNDVKKILSKLSMLCRDNGC
jgi:predicted NUDIX family NTP pyrophosphohydrolase